jgi:hypothetical protein
MVSQALRWREEPQSVTAPYGARFGARQNERLLTLLGGVRGQSSQVVQTLVSVVATGGSLLLDVGPVAPSPTTTLCYILYVSACPLCESSATVAATATAGPPFTAIKLKLTPRQ